MHKNKNYNNNINDDQQQSKMSSLWTKAERAYSGAKQINSSIHITWFECVYLPNIVKTCKRQQQPLINYHWSISTKARSRGEYCRCPHLTFLTTHDFLATPKREHRTGVLRTASIKRKVFTCVECWLLTSNCKQQSWTRNDVHFSKFRH